MIATVIGTTVGFALGAAAVTVLLRLRLRVRPPACPDPEVHELSPADREAVSAEFEAHTASVRRELSRYADELAHGDVRLREQLRQFEAGV